MRTRAAGDPPGGKSRGLCPPVRRSRVFVNAGVRDGCPTGGHVLKYACVQPSRELSLQGTGPFGVRCGGDGPGGVYVGGRDPPVVFLKAGVRDGCPTGGHVLKYACVQVSSPHLVFPLPCRRPSVGVGDGARSWRFQVPAGARTVSPSPCCARGCVTAAYNHNRGRRARGTDPLRSGPVGRCSLFRKATAVHLPGGGCGSDGRRGGRPCHARPPAR